MDWILAKGGRAFQYNGKIWRFPTRDAATAFVVMMGFEGVYVSSRAKGT